VQLEAVRTFVTVAACGQFQAAGDELDITQQAVSRRIATLERDLGVRLFVRGPKGVRLSVDGQVFLPHAHELLRVEDRATASVAPGRRALRVDVVNRRTASAGLLQAFHQQHPEIDLDIVTLPILTDGEGALAAVASGAVDLTFRTLAATTGRPPAGPRAGPDVVVPNFGNDLLLDELADSPRLATLVGEGSRYLWPASYDLRRIPIVAPVPVYPLYPLWSEQNRHGHLSMLVDYLDAHQRDDEGDGEESDDVWLPSWTRSATGMSVRP